MVQAVVVDDQPEVRSALKFLLQESAGISTIAEATSLEELLVLVHRITPNLILLDWDLVTDQPASLISLLRKLDTEVFIVALDSSPQCCRPALDAGSNYFVCKGEPPEKLLALVKEIGSKSCNKQGGKNVQD